MRNTNKGNKIMAGRNVFHDVFDRMRFQAAVYILAILLSCLAVAGSAVAADGHSATFSVLTASGHITENTTWSGTVHMTGSVWVSGGVTLTVQPGTVVKCWNNRHLRVLGSLNGYDSWFGIHDTGTWYGIEIASGGSVNLNNCDVRDAEYGIEVFLGSLTLTGCEIYNNHYGIHADLCGLTVTDCQIRSNYSRGIYAEDSSLTLTNCEIMDNTYGMYVTNSSLTITNCSISHNDDVGAWFTLSDIDPDTPIHITGNMFEGNESTGAVFHITNNTGEFNLSCNTFLNNAGSGVDVIANDCSGEFVICGNDFRDNEVDAFDLGDSTTFGSADITVSGNTATGNVCNCIYLSVNITGDCTLTGQGEFDNFPILPSISVREGGHLTISEGSVLKGGYITVRDGGTLTASGVWFTSIADDFVGGDTNNDGFATLPEDMDWNGIEFREGSSGTLDSCNVWYADNGIEVIDCSPTIMNCDFVQNSNGIYCNLLGDPRTLNIINNEFRDCTWSGISIANWYSDINISENIFNNNPQAINVDTLLGGCITVSGNIAELNDWNGIRISSRFYDVRNDCTLDVQPDFPLLSDSLGVADGAHLTIASGSVCKGFEPWVRGELTAEGVIFTSPRNDRVVGDTNNDGDATSPAPGDWRGIVFYEGSSGVINNCEVSYAEDGVKIVDSTATITYNTFKFNDRGVKLDGSYGNISWCRFFDSSDCHIDMTSDIDPSTDTIDFNEFWGGAGQLGVSGLIDAHGICVDFENNWWGDASGPEDTDSDIDICGLGANPGTGVGVMNNVDYRPWLLSPPVGPSPTPVPAPEGADFDGDGTSDIAVFRGGSGGGVRQGGSGLWAVRGVTRVYFGSGDDIPKPGDYDGDGITDIGVFRGSSGLWAVRGVTRIYFGSSSDTLVSGDYDGDGCCDVGVFRSGSGLWAVRGITRVYFGGSGDTPVPGYYDGDTAKDIGLFRPSSGLWAIRGITRVYFGSPSDTVVPGDYNGDGVWEPGIFRSASGLWAIRGLTRVYFGGSADGPILADYDGDSGDDIGIFRASSGLWAIRGVTRVYYGSSGDIPVTR